MPRESSLQRRIIRFIKAMPELFDLKPWAYKTHGSAYQQAGIPDISAVIYERSVWIETKKPGKTSTPIQLRVQKWLRQAGAAVAEIHDMEELKTFLKEEGLILP